MSVKPPDESSKAQGLTKQLRASLPRNVLVLGIVSFLMDTSSEMMMWTVPFFVARQGAWNRWQATARPGPLSLSSGVCLSHGSKWRGHRGWKAQPGGRFAGSGTSPRT